MGTDRPESSLTSDARIAGSETEPWLERVPPVGVYATLSVFLAVIFVPMAILRLIDADEGIYLYNTRLVMEGRLPYHDFHYPQMPLLLYVYGAWMKLTGISWYAGRLLSALFTITLGLVLHHHVTRACGKRAWGVLATVIFALSDLAFGWLPLVKTYALATLTLFLAYTVLDAGGARWKFFASGILFGLAVDTRLYLAALFPVFVLAACREREPAREALKFIGGVTLALLPIAYFVLLSPDSFLFNVIGHHAIRSDSGLIGNLPQKLRAIRLVLGIESPVEGSSLQFGMLFLLWICLVAAAWGRRERLPLSVGLTLVLMVVSLLPTPSYAQYFCMAIPFVIADTVRLFAWLREGARTAGGTFDARLRHVISVFLAFHVLAAVPAAHRYAIAGTDVPGIFTTAEARNWRIPTVNHVARAIDATMPSGSATAMSWWPGYFVESRASIVPGLENPFALWYSIRLPPAEITRRHLLTPITLASHIERRAVPVIVLGNWMFEAKPAYRSVVLRSGYVMVDRIEDTEIYRLMPMPHAGR